jgi:hypothetical protein
VPKISNDPGHFTVSSAGSFIGFVSGSWDNITQVVDRRGSRDTEEGAMWRTLAGVVSGLLVLFVGSLAFNAASGQSHWPGPLDLVRVHPWLVLLLLIPVSLIGLWQAPRRDRGQNPPAPMTYQLPPRNADFTARDATLRDLRQRLTSANGVAMLVVRGMGGVGKTQLAVEYAYRHLEKYRFGWRRSSCPWPGSWGWRKQPSTRSSRGCTASWRTAGPG